MRVQIRFCTLFVLSLLISSDTTFPQIHIEHDKLNSKYIRQIFLTYLDSIKKYFLQQSHKRKVDIISPLRIYTMSFVAIQFHYLIIFFFLLSILLYSQISNYSFEHYSFEHGLCSANVGAIFQDRTGYLWFGTFNGVNRFDGYNFKTYKYPGDSIVIRNEFPGSICEDGEGNIWIASHNGGLEKLNLNTDTFTNYLPNPSKPKNDWCNFVLSVYSDKKDIIWVGTGNGFYKYDKVKGSFSSFLPDVENPYSLGHHSVNAIYEDRSGTMWLATGGGLDKYDRDSNKFYHYWHYQNNGWGERKTAMHWVLSIIEDNAGIIWLGTDEGLVEFNRKTGKFVRHVYKNHNSITRPNNIILSICEIGPDYLWLATQGGLGVFNKNTKTITYQTHDEKKDRSLSSDLLTSIIKDRSGSVWISTTLGGVNKVDLPNTLFDKFFSGTLETENLSSDNVFALLEGDGGKIWVQTPKGLGKFDRNTRKFQSTFYPFNYAEVFDDQEGNILVSPNVGGLYKLGRNNRWMCYIDSTKDSYSSRIVSLYPSDNNKKLLIGNLTGDLYLLDQITNSKKLIKNITNAVTVICEDKTGLVWFGGIATGLFCYDPAKDTVYQFYADPKNPKALDDNSILVIYEDRAKILWIGTNKGLQKFNDEDYTFERIIEKDDFFADGVRQILEDKHGNLWISTRKGICMFNPRTGQSQNFFSESEFYGIDFFRGVGCITKDGEMFFGGAKGFVHFYPDSIKEFKFVPPIVITSFRLFEKPIALDSSIELSHKDNFLSFEFAALSFANSKENQYAYKMEGLDKDWIYCGNRRYVSYPNLDPGEYVFRVRGSTSNRTWNEAGASVRITILSPWWKTNWAYAFYFLLVVSLVYFFWKFHMRRIKMNHAYEISQLQAQKLNEVDEIKTRFFTNISHEFRTPLTLILGPVKELIERTNDNRTKEDLNLVHRNAKRLHNLVNQLLDISKLESGTVNLHAVPTNIVMLVKALTLSFASYAERKKIQLNFISDSNEITAYIDKDKMEKIFTNVMSNAFKFTPDGGQIEVMVGELKEGFVEISIRDTGIGISSNKLSKIFDRFYQVDSSHTREHEGTGIGLSLTKELVELHKGNIEVESEEGMGTVVTVKIPLGKAHLKPEEIFENEIEPIKEKGFAYIEETYSDQEKIKSETEFDKSESLPLVLIVEDNADVRTYVKNILLNAYNIMEAKDGEDGWNKCIESVSGGPDLVISDIMMPKMDGFKLCDKLKTDERTSHIPVILLTAKATKHDKIDGFELGADDYIMKPFETDEFRARVRNLIMQRKRLHEHFKKTGLLDFESTPITSVDKKFLQKTLEIIKQHLSDTAFNVESLSEYLSVSKSVLQKKISALTGETPIEFIRKIRLKKAVELIEKKFGNMSEIALEAGFSNPAYFSEMFKREFGMTPKEYQQKIKKN